MGLGAVLLTIGIALAQGVITRDQPALVTVTGQLNVHETLVLYPDLNGQPDLANPVGPADLLDFGDVELDAFGNVAGGPPRIPLYVFNNAGSDLALTVEASGDGPEPTIEVLFGQRGGELELAPGNQTDILAGQIFTADLGIRFLQAPGSGDLNFTVSFVAEASTVPQGLIAFSSNRDGDQEIYVMNVDGSNVVQLTNNQEEDQAPVWSPDGGNIAFQSYRDGSWQVYVMATDGSGQTRITGTGENLWPSWAPEGSRLAYNSDRDGNVEIYVIDGDGSNPARLTANPAEDSIPDWSPDGTKIAFRSKRSGDANIFVMSADGTNPVPLTSSGGSINSAPDWSPDNSSIAFSTNRDGNQEIYAMDADGANPVNLTNDSASDGVPAWSPSGNLIAFQSERDGNGEIYVMNADGSNVIRLTNDPGNDASPDWFPGVGP